MMLDSVAAESIDRRCRDLPVERDNEFNPNYFKETPNISAGIP